MAKHSPRDRASARHGMLRHDHTEAKRAPAAFTLLEQQLSLALQAGHMGTWEWDISTNTVNWSPELEKIHGIEPGSFAGTLPAFQKSIHPDDHDRVMRVMNEALEHDPEFRTEYRIVRPDGSLHWLEASGKVLRDMQGTPRRMIGVCADVSDQRVAEAAIRATARSLARERERLAIALRSGRLGVYEWRLFDDTVWWSPEIYPLYGVDPARFTPSVQSFNELIHPDDRVEHERRMHESIEHRDVFSYEYRIVRPDGAVRWIATYSRVSHDHSGNAERVTGVAMDITDRKRAESVLVEREEALRESDRRKDEFLAMLSHELRNPLAPMRNAIAILEKIGPPTPEVRWAHDIINRQIMQMTRLVDDLMDVSRITRGKIELRRQRVELRAIVNDAVEASRPVIEQSRHRLEVNMPAEPLWIDVDPMRLAQVLLNLLNNAAKYTDPGGHIEISARQENHELVIRVRDSGVGIPRDMLPHIFEMFAQADRSIERSQGGIGIGLTLVDRILALHGGRVQALSDGPGRGSEFVVWLPLGPGATTGAPVAHAGSKPAATRAPQHRILVVDDNEDSATSMAVYLRMIGHDVRTAHDGLAAVERAAAFSPSFVLLDIGLPKLNGYDAAERIRKRCGADVTLIALTGWGQDEDRRRSREAGFDHHLTKPVDFDHLNRLLANDSPASRRDSA